jgi:hypothetical protein
MSATMITPPAATQSAVKETPIVVTRRRIDRVLIGLGGLAAVVFATAGGLLMWGNNFADDYVERELESQNIVFPSAEALTADGRTDLLEFAGQPLDTGDEAEAYASYINGHLEETAGGLTYAELGAPERAARTALADAKESGAPQATIDDLQANYDEVSGQRNTLFKGETLRGLLLSAYAWSTVGMIAGIAAIAAFVAAAAALVLVGAGLVHLRRMHAQS